MDEKTAVLRVGNEERGQLQIIYGANGSKRVQLYNAGGVRLCEVPFSGDDETGFAMGQALFTGYMAGWDNCQFAFTKSVMNAMSGASGGLKL